MSQHEFTAMGTEWCVEADDGALLKEAELIVRRAEQRLSRFDPASALSRLNRHRQVIDPTVAAVARAALDLRELTAGAFDPCVGARLREIGYDRTFAAVESPVVASVIPNRHALRVHIEADQVWLHGDGDLDLGGIAKGWAVDRVLQWLLDNGARDALVDGGGDIAAAGGPCIVGVGDHLVVNIAQRAVATSSTRRRRWRARFSDSARGGADLHHLIDPRTGWPTTSAIDTASVVAADAATADALATAVMVNPNSLLPRLASMHARAAVRGVDGAWWVTPNWEHNP